jgi:acyl-CoA synthetase (AMP-forming)/AMP-acid ligase II
MSEDAKPPHASAGPSTQGGSEARSVARLLEKGAPEAFAIGAPDGVPPLRYRDLAALAARTVGDLNRFGIGRGDRVAIVVPNGPEAAAAFVSIAAGATTAPLNPEYRAEELEFYLSDLRAKAVVVAAGMESPVRGVARERSIPVIELEAHRERGAGSFTLRPPDGLGGAPARPGFGEEGDVALVLHTSGTTARPKIVPLTQGNILASARHIGRTLRLTPDDVCLNVMPLFHIHGLMAGTLATLGAGAQVCCTPHFSALRFFHWFEEAKPTWYTAVPSMHQAVLVRAARHHEDVLARSRLRFIRSSSAALARAVMSDLERIFRAPVIESYGMTEAAHQMASNPLPPGERVPGSVGLAAGPDLGIMDEDGKLLPVGGTGEVVVRGPNVMSGYENNPDANAKAFASGWFRTGDQGALDEGGYLRITGRLKELINRGGEKVSPLEVDEVLLHHPSVQQAVTFPVAHPMLGEEVAAAVVLREEHEVTDYELRDYVANHVSHFKVPRKILIVREIPKGPTGKLQRIGLAKKLGLEP